MTGRTPPSPRPEFRSIERLSPAHSQGGHTHSHGGHSHSHGGHSHSHEALPAPLPSTNSSLSAGAGVGRTLLFDTPSGIAGDMTIAALLDLGVPLAVVERAVATLPLDGYRLEHMAARSGSLGGSRFIVHVTGPQPERDYAAIDGMLAAAALEDRVKVLSRAIFRRLAEAESEVHRMPLDRVAFHEVGAIDAIVDIVGAAACVVHVGARVVGTPLPLGRGFVECQHGILPLPAPATLLCLKGVPTYDPGITGEFVTPTGAAIIATIAEAFGGWPSFTPERVGVGCGTRVLPNRPNALRAVLGVAAAAQAESSHVVLEANIDDMTGELAAHAIEVLLQSGALDAWAQAVTMKKGRPGLVLSVVAERALADSLASVMLRESTSIGVRRTDVSRIERPRRVVEVDTRFGRIPLKVSEGAYGPALAKPEFDACRAAAERAQVAVRDVIAAALLAYDALR